LRARAFGRGRNGCAAADSRRAQCRLCPHRQTDSPHAPPRRRFVSITEILLPNIARNKILHERALLRATRQLAAQDPHLRQIVERFGPPPMWAREPGFDTLIQIILEQQVSIASALAAFNRLVAATNPLTPERFLELDDAA